MKTKHELKKNDMKSRLTFISINDPFAEFLLFIKFQLNGKLNFHYSINYI